MARTALAVTDVPFQSGIANISFTAVDQPNGNKFDNDGNTILIVKDTGGGNCTVTVRAVADEAGRSVDLVLVVPLTTGIGIMGPFRAQWWNQRAAPDVGAVGVDFSTGTGVTAAALRLKD